MLSSTQLWQLLEQKLRTFQLLMREFCFRESNLVIQSKEFMKILIIVNFVSSLCADNCANLDRLTPKRQRGRYWCVSEDKTGGWKRVEPWF